MRFVHPPKLSQAMDQVKNQMRGWTKNKENANSKWSRFPLKYAQIKLQDKLNKTNYLNEKQMAQLNWGSVVDSAQTGIPPELNPTNLENP